MNHDRVPLQASEISGATLEAALGLLGSSNSGLTSDEAERRLRTYGPNEIAARPAANRAGVMARNFTNVLAILLWIAALFAFVGSLPEIGWAIVAVIVVNGVFTFVQEYRANSLLEALRRRFLALALVRRDGRLARLDARSVVPGDVIRLTEGQRVPADARIISAAGLEVDQSSLSGESLSIAKDTETHATSDVLSLANIVYAGTLVVRGDGEAVVFATGSDTQFGAITALTYAMREAPTPLEREVQDLSLTTAAVAVGAGLAIWGLSSVWLDLSVRQGMIFAIGVLVALVPEGLLPTLSLSLAIGAQRMARRNVLVRRLSAIEALGATQVICTDKTGTLTLNRMTPALALTSSGEHDFTERQRGRPEADLLDLLTTMAFASSVSQAEVYEAAAGPDPIEAAILTSARDAGVELAGRRLRELPFDSFRRMMSTVDLIDGRTYVHTKGAPDAVVARCLPETLARFREEPEQVADRYGNLGMRVLAAARRPLIASELESGADIEQNLEFVGLMAFADPVRPEVVEAVQRCTTAGIRVVIITGDHPGTAAAVAEKTGISLGRPHVVTGANLEMMSPAELRAALSRDVVFARATPAHKLSIVAALQEMGQVVAVVGDGVNDAPSLRHADVGVAMGKGGTDVAREAADIVLADDNFATIVDGIEEGRAIFANIRRFVTYVFTSNVAELAPFVAYVLTGIPLPLKVLQILAVDVGTDLIPALGLGAEPPESRALDQPPRRRGERLLNATVLQRIFVFFGPFEAAFALGGFFFVYWLDGWRPGDELAGSGATYMRATTMTFAVIVVGQIGASLACARSTRSVLSNRLLLTGLLIEVAIVLSLGRVPPLRDTLGFVPLGWRELAYLAVILPVIPSLEVGRRALQRRRLTVAQMATLPSR